MVLRALLTVRLQRPMNAPLPRSWSRSPMNSRDSGDMLEPRVIFRADPLD